MLPLHIACKRQTQFQTIHKILRLNVDALLHQDKLGNNPLHYVCGNSDSDEKIVELLLDTEKELRKNKESNIDPVHSKRLVETKNKKKETPLFLAVKSGGSGAYALLEPENIFLDGLEDEEIREDVLAKDDIAEFLLQNRSKFQESIVNTLAGRRYFPFMFLELAINIFVTVRYIDTTLRILRGGDPIRSIETVQLIICIVIYSLRELIQLVSGKLSDYFLDAWNYIEMASIVALAAATLHMLMMKYVPDTQAERSLFATCGVLLLLQVIFFIRTTFYPFARFVAGIIRIVKGLLPFIVLSVMLLLMFTYTFLVYGDRKEACSIFSQCFIFTLEAFLFGLEDFSNSSSFIREILFGLLAVIIL